MEFIPKKRNKGSRQQQARWKRRRKQARGERTWDYDPLCDRYELFPEQLANLSLGKEHNAAIARANRAVVQRWRAKGYSARDIVLLTGLSRPTVYRHLAVSRDPLLL